jgi:hypothetical protein
MGSPTSPVLSAVYIQFMENTKLHTILIKNKVLGYFRYIDDILIVYNDADTDVDVLLDLFNNTMPTMTFSIQKMTNNSINDSQDCGKRILQHIPENNHNGYHNT